MDLSILDHPWQLTLALLLSAIGFVFFVAGTKARNPSWVLYGIAASVPPFSIASPVAWLIATAIAGAAFWLARFMA